MCLFLTNKWCSHNHSVFVVCQPCYAVSVLGRPEVKHVPDVLAFVDHWFGSFKQEVEAIRCQFNHSSQLLNYRTTFLSLLASCSNKEFPVLHPQAIFKGHRTCFHIYRHSLKHTWQGHTGLCVVWKFPKTDLDQLINWLIWCYRLSPLSLWAVQYHDPAGIPWSAISAALLCCLRTKGQQVSAEYIKQQKSLNPKAISKSWTTVSQLIIIIFKAFHGNGKSHQFGFSYVCLLLHKSRFFKSLLLRSVAVPVRAPVSAPLTEAAPVQSVT